jgi:arylsulfatase A-like enzyme
MRTVISRFLLVLVAAGSACAAGAAGQTRPARPNVVFILADNLGYGDLGCYGCPDIRTPAIDRLASEGVRLTSYYAGGPECTPSRTALLTGRYPQRVGGLECAIGSGHVGRYDDAIRLRARHELGLPASEDTLVGGLKRAGYRAVGFGKWHLGYEKKFLPPAHGFDYFLGTLGGTVDYFYHTEPNGDPALFENDRLVRREGYLTDLITEGAVKFLQRQGKAKPFFLYLPYTAPSAPHQRPDRKPPAPKVVKSWDSKEWQQGTREVYALMVQRLDQGVGKVLKTLDEAGLRANTLVIFASDNGGYALARNAPFRGGASELLEGGIRVPCIVRWPGVLPRGMATDRPAMTFDLTASILRAAGASVPARQKLDGIDILKRIEENRPIANRALFWRARRGDRTWRAVRQGTLKYLSRQDGDRVEEHLFDLANDPGEKKDLLADRPEDARRLKQLLSHWEAEARPSR